MTTIKIEYSRQFLKSFEKLPSIIKRKAENKDKIFRQNPFSPQLKTHKLKGELKQYSAYSVDRNYRILFRFIDKNRIICFDIGTHKIYK